MLQKIVVDIYRENNEDQCIKLLDEQVLQRRPCNVYLTRCSWRPRIKTRSV